MSQRVELTGKQFNKWVVLEYAGLHKSPKGKTSSQYSCLCECGNFRLVSSNALLSNKSKSCGCIKRLPEGIAARNQVFTNYRTQAGYRKLSFKLTKKQFFRLIVDNCYYCGASPTNIKIHKWNTGTYTYNGIDRKDNTLGYINTNVITCCKQCNLAKRGYSIEQFFDMVQKIYERHLK